MFFDNYIRDFDDITKDVGQEIKDTARTIYTTGVLVYKILLALEFVFLAIGSIGIIINDFEQIFIVVIMFLGYFVLALIQYWLIVNSLYRIAIEMYGRGESIHLLREISKQGTPQVKNVEMPQEAVIEPAQETFVPVAHYDSWLCKKCGTQNKKQYGQCKKCGTYRSNETSWEPEMPKAYTAPVIEEKAAPSPHLADTWKCWFCGTENAMKYGQCKKCGKFKNS